MRRVQNELSEVEKSDSFNAPLLRPSISQADYAHQGLHIFNFLIQAHSLSHNNTPDDLGPGFVHLGHCQVAHREILV